MSFEKEMVSMQSAIEKLVTATLSNIHKSLADGKNDFVLADTDDNFKTFFLETAKERIDYAYKAYVKQAKFQKLIPPINNKDLAEAPMTLPSDLKEAKGSTAANSTPTIRPAVPSVSSDISAIEKSRQLQLQNELQNTLRISGLPIRSGDQEWLLSLVKTLCDHLSVQLDANDIENIHFDGRALIVTFNKQYLKDDVLIAYRREKKLKSNQVLKLLPGEMSTTIGVRQETTEFYEILTSIANRYVSQNDLYCFRINNQGLGIMFTQHDKRFLFVQSEYELHERISRYKFTKKVSFAVD